MMIQDMSRKDWLQNRARVIRSLAMDGEQLGLMTDNSDESICSYVKLSADATFRSWNGAIDFTWPTQIRNRSSETSYVQLAITFWRQCQ